MRKLYVISLIGVMLFTGCTSKEKSIILSEDTSNDVNAKYEVSVENIKYGTYKKQTGMPVFYDNNDLYMIRVDGDLESINKAEMLKYNSGNINVIKDINPNSSVEENGFSSRYYTGDKENTGGLRVIKDWITGKEYDFNRIENDYSNVTIANISTDNNFQFLLNNSNFYTDTFLLKEVIQDNNNNNIPSIYNVHQSTIRLCNFIDGKSYLYESSKENGDENIVTKIDYSPTLKKFFGFNDLGQVFELELEDEKIKAKLIYKIPIEENEIIAMDNGFNRGTVISGDKVLYHTYTETYKEIVTDIKVKDGVDNVEVSDDTLSSGYTMHKQVTNSKILDLSTLELKDIGVNIANTYTNVFKLAANYVLINTNNKENNEYALVDLSSDNLEIVYKFTLSKNHTIRWVTGNEEGTKVAFEIVEFKNLENIFNPEFISSEVLELNINKLF